MLSEDWPWAEPAEVMYDIISAVEPFAPKNKIRYLMGVGTPGNIIEGVYRECWPVRLCHAQPQCPPWPPVHLGRHH